MNTDENRVKFPKKPQENGPRQCHCIGELHRDFSPTLFGQLSAGVKIYLCGKMNGVKMFTRILMANNLLKFQIDNFAAIFHLSRFNMLREGGG